MWTLVTSNKPKRAGEVFIQRDGRFVLKVYRDAPVPDVRQFAQYLVDQLNKQEDKRKEE